MTSIDTEMYVKTHTKRYFRNIWKKTLILKKVRFPTNQDKPLNDTSTAASWTDYIGEVNVYRIFSRFLVDMGLVNHQKK